MQTQHRLSQIVDGLVDLFSVLKDDTTTSGFPIKVPVVIKKYQHWSALEVAERRLNRQVFPALMLNFGEGGNRITGGTQAEFASLGQTEDHLEMALIGIVKETKYATDDLTDQVANLIFSVERLINGTHDLGVDGVERVTIEEVPQTSAGRAAAVSGEEMDIIVFPITVVHVYRASTFA